MFWDIVEYASKHPKILFIVITFINLLNYVDRGIVPGATNEFTSFILETVDTTNTDV